MFVSECSRWGTGVYSSSTTETRVCLLLLHQNPLCFLLSLFLNGVGGWGGAFFSSFTPNMPLALRRDYFDPYAGDTQLPAIDQAVKSAALDAAAAQRSAPSASVWQSAPRGEALPYLFLIPVNSPLTSPSPLSPFSQIGNRSHS